MKIIVSSNSSVNRKSFEDYARQKLAKLSKYHPKILEISAHLRTERAHRGQEDDYYCEIKAVVPGCDLEIVDNERAMDKAIDKAVERLKRLLIKNKEKKISKLHQIGILSKLKNRFF